MFRLYVYFISMHEYKMAAHAGHLLTKCEIVRKASVSYYPNIFVDAQIGRTEGDSSQAAKDWYYYPIKTQEPTDAAR